LGGGLSNIELTAAGRAFSRPCTAGADSGEAAARHAAQPVKPTFAMGFLTGQEVDWLRRLAEENAS
jgi:LysR family hca operon transcriptional activator